MVFSASLAKIDEREVSEVNMFFTGYVILLNKTQLSIDVNVKTLKGKSHRFYSSVHNNAKLLSLQYWRRA